MACAESRYFFLFLFFGVGLSFMDEFVHVRMYGSVIIPVRDKGDKGEKAGVRSLQTAQPVKRQTETSQITEFCVTSGILSI